MDGISHRTYFMPDLFYEIPKLGTAKERPYKMLDENEWRKVMQHLFAHTVEREGGANLAVSGRVCMSRSALLDYLQHTKNLYSERDMLDWITRMYLQEGGEYFDPVFERTEPFRIENTDIPKEERKLFRKISTLYMLEKKMNPDSGFLV